MTIVTRMNNKSENENKNGKYVLQFFYLFNYNIIKKNGKKHLPPLSIYIFSFCFELNRIRYTDILLGVFNEF